MPDNCPFVKHFLQVSLDWQSENDYSDQDCKSSPNSFGYIYLLESGFQVNGIQVECPTFVPLFNRCIQTSPVICLTVTVAIPNYVSFVGRETYGVYGCHDGNPDSG